MNEELKMLKEDLKKLLKQEVQQQLEAEISPMQPANEKLIDNLETLKVLSDPLRMQILEVMRYPITVKEVAKALGLPQTKLYYHVGQMEEHDLIRVVETRVVSGIIEKQYQVVAKYFKVDRSLLAVVKDDTESFIEVFRGVTETVLQDVGRGIKRGVLVLDQSQTDPNRLFFSLGRVNLSQAQALKIYQRLGELVQEILHSDEIDPEANPPADTRQYNLLTAFFPHTPSQESHD